MSRLAVNRIKNKLSILNLHVNWWGQEGISSLRELHRCSLLVLFHLMKHLVPITGGMILKQMDQHSDLLWQCLAYPAWVGSCWKDLRSIFIFSGFFEATRTAVYVCFSSFLLVKEDSCWPNAFNESWEVLLTCQQQPLKMETVMHTWDIAVLLCRLKSSSVSSWTSKDEFPAAILVLVALWYLKHLPFFVFITDQ